MHHRFSNGKLNIVKFKSLPSEFSNFYKIFSLKIFSV